MAQKIRSYAAAGAAIAVAGAVAVAPAPSEALPDRALRLASPAVQLTTTADPFLAWVEVFNNTSVNFADLTSEYLKAPFPVVQQVVANWYNYVQMLPDIGDIFEDIVENANALVENQIAPQTDNLDALHQLIFSVVEAEIPASLKPLIDYTTNYNSGMVIGALGLVVSPLLALGDQLSEFVTELGDGEFGNAVNALINIPAAMTDGFFNGHGILDLTFLAGILPVPPGTDVEELGIAMGGLFSPAGSIFNSLNAVVKLTGLPKITVPGVKAGLLGSWFAANQSSAEAIGWSGEGNPLAALLTEGEEAEEAEEAEGTVEALAAADEVPAAALDAELTAVTVDVEGDVAEGDVESDVAEGDVESDVAEGDVESDVAEGDVESDVDEGDVESDV
ncbi:MAG: outer membrane porin GjpA, partial [Actinomycetia bacterium]|nr:outer membrane porin GjpA [Actinomycetes bacterium]